MSRDFFSFFNIIKLGCLEKRLSQDYFGQDNLTSIDEIYG